MRPQLVALVSHALRRNLEETAIPFHCERSGMERAEDRLSLQLSNGLVDSLLSFRAAPAIGWVKKTRCFRTWAFRRWIVFGRNWPEPWSGSCAERSQELVAAFLEELKRTSMTQLRLQKDVDALIKELDGLNFNQKFSLQTSV